KGTDIPGFVGWYAVASALLNLDETITKNYLLMNPSHPFSDLLLNMTRRELFKRSGVALGAAALEWLLAGSAGAAGAQPGVVNPLAPRPPHFPARAKRVIYMHMVGAPSQIDLFEYK